jgi:hypothetical protein
MEKLASCRTFAGYPRDNGNKFLKEFESFAILYELIHKNKLLMTQQEHVEKALYFH